ncbi:cytochrome P450 [Macrolepiota fuliginosa MF-IS2]|uniref:Cytochrome P450 n=1 Tax=Macrolepiota fuliginosa MF-IS2 TaxID=1400762 RepID=A0A9P5X5N5_9AGAR|nr:cytochrome P450 [Macrolepiota fuliginosa MF-IS2]
MLILELTLAAGRFVTGHYILCTTFVILSYTIYKTLIYPTFFSPLRHIPGPPILPPASSSITSLLYKYLLGSITGQFPAIINGEAGIPQREWLKAYGGDKGVLRVVGPVGIERVMFISPEACEKIMVRDWPDYPRPNFMKDVLGLVAGVGLLTAEKNDHKQMKKMMNPAFSLPNLVSQINKHYDTIESLIKVLQDQVSASSSGVILPMYEWTSKASLDIICSTAFSYYPDNIHNHHNELAYNFERVINLQNGANMAWLIGLVVCIPSFPAFAQSELAWKIRGWISRIPKVGLLSVIIDAMHRIRAHSRGLLEEKMRESMLNAEMDLDTDTERKDIMSLLVKARKESLASEPGGWSLGDQALKDQVLTFLGAGHETTASGIAWTLYLLAANKGVQDKLREEITPLLAVDSRPEYRALKELQWLDCVVMESLRVLPPVPMTFRKAAKTDYVDGVLIPEGTLLYIPIRVINTHTSIWGPDAEDFRPSRWLDLPKNYNPYSLMTFFAGPHACIGKTMAIMEMKTVLSSLIANFEFDLAYEGQVPQPTAAVTMKPKDNMPLIVRRVRTL